MKNHLSTLVFATLLFGLTGCEVLTFVSNVISKGEKAGLVIPEENQKTKEELTAIEEKAPRPECELLNLDIKAGTLNGMTGLEELSEIKEKLPCYTGETEEGSGFNCGGGVFYLNHDFYFYSGRDYLEVRSKFDGTSSEIFWGKSSTDLEAVFGLPAKVSEYGGKEYYHFNRPWGVMVAEISESKGVELLQFHHGRQAHQIQLCY